MEPILGRLRTLDRRDAMVAGATLGLLAITALAVVLFFPGRDAPALEASARWPGRGERLLGPLVDVPAFVRGRIFLQLRNYTPNTSARVRVDDVLAGRIAVDANGRGRGSIALPARVTRGTHALRVRDAGTGNEAPPLDVVIVRGPSARLWAGPRPLPHRSALLVGAGFGRRTAVSLAVSDRGGPSLDLGSTHTRADGHFALLVGVPAAVERGDHRLVARDEGGRTATAIIVVAH